MSRSNSRINCLLVVLLAAGLSLPALAQSVPFPTYEVGANQNGSQGPNYPSTLPNPWVVSNGQIITPAGTQVYLGTTTRAKAIALNPNTSTHTAAVLQMGAPQSVTIFNTQTGAFVQNFKFNSDKDGSDTGIAYTSDGKYLLFSQDGDFMYGAVIKDWPNLAEANGGFVAIASVDPTTGMLSNYAQVGVPMAIDAYGSLTNVTCYTSTGYQANGLPDQAPLPAGVSPPGTTGSFNIPCGKTVTTFSDETVTSYPTGIAISPDNKTAYVVLQNNDSLAKIDLTQTPPVKVGEVRVGNVPHTVVISPDGTKAYVSNKAGRIAAEKDFQEYSNGTPVVANP